MKKKKKEIEKREKIEKAQLETRASDAYRKWRVEGGT